MKKILILLLLSPIFALGNPIDYNCSKNVIWGAPILQEGNNQYLCRTDYAVNYSYKNKTPFYVVEHITQDHIKLIIDRKNNFHEDLDIIPKYRSTLKDYFNTGYDKGHLAPAGDFTYNKDVMSQSFLLSNMIPQNKNNNRVIWNHLEQNIRRLVNRSGSLYVITGTIYSKEYKTIGNNVGVPNEIYKIIIDDNKNRMIAFKFPNISIDPKLVANYIVSVKSIEDITGIDFFPNIPTDLKYLEFDIVEYKDWFL